MKIVTGVASLGAVAAVVLLAAAPFSPTKEVPLTAYINLIEELDHRKRVNVLFPNPQSIFDGYHIGFVNVSAGNLTFRRRDLVTRTAGMVVEFTRVYDSRIERNADFGAGWRLSLAEEVTLEDGALVYVDRAGARHQFASEDRVEYRANPTKPSHAETSITVTEKGVVIRTSDGALRTFEPQLGEPYRYVISTFKTPHSDELSFSYQDGVLSSVQARGKHIFVLARDAGGKVASVRDHHGRVVSYSYTANGQLKDVIDIGGNLWWHEYGEFGLTRAIGPNRQPFLVVRYQDAKVVESRSGHSYAFVYRHDRTSVTDGSGVERSFFNEESGVTYRLASSNGTDWHLTLGARNEVTELRTAGENHAFWYDGTGRLEKMHHVSSDGRQDSTLVYEGDRLVRMLSANDTTTIDYDGNTTRLSTPSSKVEFTMDDGQVRRADFQIVRSDLPSDGRTVDVEYNRMGDVMAIRSHTRGMRHAQGVRFTRNTLGQITSTTYANGFESIYEYDTLGNRVSSSYAGSGSQQYVHDPSGNIVSISSSGPNGSSGTQSYSIGEMNRVTRITNADSDVYMDIEYDQNGNAINFKTDDDTVHAKYEGGNLVRIWSSRTGDALAIDDHILYGMEVDRVHERTPSKRKVLTRSMLTAQPYYGMVVFDEGSHAARAADPVQAYVPYYSDAMAIVDLAGGFADGGSVADFEKPSNTAFHPPEYRSINCCIPCVTVGCSCEYSTAFSPVPISGPVDCSCLAGWIDWLLDQLEDDTTDQGEDEEKEPRCLPCTPPVGTRMYKGEARHFRGGGAGRNHGVPGNYHVHHYVVGQSPANIPVVPCQCQRHGGDATASREEGEIIWQPISGGGLDPC